jgi:hypothetical protein
VSRSVLALLHAFAWFACLSLATACGGDDDDDGGAGSPADSGGSGGDASPRDAAAEADASVCTLTMCGDECVDTATDSAHCGGCDMACDSPGQICAGALPCACPPDWVPADLTRTPGSEVTTDLFPGLLVGVAPVFDGDLVSAVLVAFVEDTPVDTDIDLASVAAPAPPFVAAARDVDVETSAVHTPYLATAGTLHFTELCAQGARGTVTDAVFVEVGGVTDPTPVDGGCQEAVASIEFAIGQPCGAGPDAGPASR